MTEGVRAALWRELQARGITGPDMFAARYGRRLCDLTPVKALEIIMTPAMRSVPISKTVSTTQTLTESEDV